MLSEQSYRELRFLIFGGDSRCSFCGRPFTTFREGHIYCSKRCRNHANFHKQRNKERA